MDRNATYHEAVGAFHLHSTWSDGSLPIPEIARIAEKKQLDFLMFSDHNTLEPKRQGLEGWYGRVLVLIGCEINDPDDRNHYLAFRINEEIEKGIQAEAYVRRVKEAGGFGVIAHPSEKRRFSEAYPPYPWTAWDAEGFDGIEIWNHLSEWLEGVTRINLPWRLLHPLRSVRFPVWETLERWDRLNLTRRVVGLGGLDVHAYPWKLLGIFPMEIWPYKVQFRSIRTHLLTQKPLKESNAPIPFYDAEGMVFEAIGAGRCFISNASLGDARGFTFHCLAGESVLPVGSRHPVGSDVLFQVRSPGEGDIRLVQNGKTVSQVRGPELTFRSEEPGVFRVEVHKKHRGWIYTNPIVITEHLDR